MFDIKMFRFAAPVSLLVLGGVLLPTSCAMAQPNDAPGGVPKGDDQGQGRRNGRRGKNNRNYRRAWGAAGIKVMKFDGMMSR